MRNGILLQLKRSLFIGQLLPSWPIAQFPIVTLLTLSTVKRVAECDARDTQLVYGLSLRGTEPKECFLELERDH